MPTLRLPLSRALHRALRAEAAAQGRTATDLMQEALRDWLSARRKERLAAELHSYAEAMAGSGFDLDPDLERAGIEQLEIDAERS